MSTAPAPVSAPDPTLALALGAGGARGLAHICVLEALDEMGVTPCLIAGSSMGAVIGAAYAAGVSGSDLRAYVLDMLQDRTSVMGKLLRARTGRFRGMFTGGLDNPVMIDGMVFLDMFWPEAVPNRFSQLKIPFIAMATDYAARREVRLDSGPLAPAVAASMAIPGLIKPVDYEGMVLVDGGTVNPLPHDVLMGRADVILAVDVTGGPLVSQNGSSAIKAPRAFEIMLGAAQIMLGTITMQKLRLQRPDILVTPRVDNFRALDFFKAKEILAAADACKDDVKRDLEAALLAAGRKKRGEG